MFVVPLAGDGLRADRLGPVLLCSSALLLLYYTALLLI
jgi:hypothetical protein